MWSCINTLRRKPSQCIVDNVCHCYFVRLVLNSVNENKSALLFHRHMNYLPGLLPMWSFACRSISSNPFVVLFSSYRPVSHGVKWQEAINFLQFLKVLKSDRQDQCARRCRILFVWRTGALLLSCNFANPRRTLKLTNCLCLCTSFGRQYANMIRYHSAMLCPDWRILTHRSELKYDSWYQITPKDLIGCLFLGDSPDLSPFLVSSLNGYANL